MTDRATPLTDAIADNAVYGSGSLADKCIEHARRLERDRAMLREACEAAIQYDNAIRDCANDPAKMASFCTAEGDDLDALYADWITKARAALAAPPSERDK